MRKVARIFVLTILLTLGLVFPAWAGLWWEKPEDHPTPSAYASRVYTRQHWTDFYVNEQMFLANWNSPGSRLLFSGRCSVFDLPGSLTEGYTAVGDKDEVAWSAAFILDTLGVPQVDGYFIVSPAYWREHPASEATAVFTGSGEMIFAVPVYTVRDGSGLNPNRDTITNPKCFSNGPNGFEAGGYSGNVGYHWFSQGQRSPISLTRECATAAWNHDRTTRAAICYSYIYGLTVTGLAPAGSASDRQTWKASVINTTPYIAKDVKLRAYLVHGGKYELAADTVTDIGPIPLGDGWGGLMQPTSRWNLGNGVAQDGALYNTITWTFSVPVPSDDYKVLVTANLNFLGSKGWSEPLKTISAYGHNAHTIEGLTGTRPEAAYYIIPPGNTFDTVDRPAYVDNYAFSGYQSGQPPEKPDDVKPNDLAVTAMQVVDTSNDQPVSSAKPNQTLKVKASFKSSFDVGGWAKVRFYKYQPEYKRLDQVGDTINVYVEPRASFNRESIGFNTGPGQYKFFATIDYYNNGNDPSTGWKPEKFDGKYEEETYDNNKKDWDLTGSENEPWKPQPAEFSQSGWYPPKYWKEVAKYEDYTEDIYGWKKVPYEKKPPENNKVKVRLVE